MLLFFFKKQLNNLLIYRGKPYITKEHEVLIAGKLFWQLSKNSAKNKNSKYTKS